VFLVYLFTYCMIESAQDRPLPRPIPQAEEGEKQAVDVINSIKNTLAAAKPPAMRNPSLRGTKGREPVCDFRILATVVENRMPPAVPLFHPSATGIRKSQTGSEDENSKVSDASRRIIPVLRSQQFPYRNFVFP
jgi:hypothetical protein